MVAWYSTNEKRPNCEIIDQGERGFRTCTKNPFLLIENTVVEFFFVNTTKYITRVQHTIAYVPYSILNVFIAVV
jgi:hypothetical protein